MLHSAGYFATGGIQSIEPGVKSDSHFKGIFMGEQTGKNPGGTGGPAKPDWANGLRQLYDSVVEEPIPDSFQDLLSKLDDDKSDRS